MHSVCVCYGMALSIKFSTHTDCKLQFNVCERHKKERKMAWKRNSSQFAIKPRIDNDMSRKKYVKLS